MTKEEIKVFFFFLQRFDCLRIPEEWHTPTTKSCYSKVAGYKLNIQKSFALLISQLQLSFYRWVVRVLYEFCISVSNQVYSWQIFSPISGLSFYYLGCVLCSKRVFCFMKYSLFYLLSLLVLVLYLKGLSVLRTQRFTSVFSFSYYIYVCYHFCVSPV